MQSNEIIKLYSTLGREAYPGTGVLVSICTLIPKNKKNPDTDIRTSADLAATNIQSCLAMTAWVKTNPSLGL